MKNRVYGKKKPIRVIPKTGFDLRVGETFTIPLDAYRFMRRSDRTKRGDHPDTQWVARLVVAQDGRWAFARDNLGGGKILFLPGTVGETRYLNIYPRREQRIVWVDQNSACSENVS